MIFKIILNPTIGILNKLTGLDINWIADPRYALICVAVLTAWLNSGINFLYFSAGLGNIDESIYERASVDGANGIQKFFRLTPGQEVRLKGAYIIKCTDRIEKDADGNVIPTGIAEVLIYSNYAMPVKMNIPFSPEQPLQIKASSLEPGFTAIEVRYPAGEKEFTSAGAGVGFAPGQLHPVSREPEDFDRFWNNAIAEQSKIPADMIITPLPEFDEPGYNAFRISFANINNTRIHGFMTIPSAPGKYPMFLSVPGAGPRDTRPVKLEEVDNLKAITVVLNVFPFELPTSYDAAEKLLAEHYNGNPSSYYKAEKDYRDFFFYRAIVGINRAVSELATHPKYNGKMVYWGSSQGGAMGVALTALNKNIDAMVVNVPDDFRKLFLRAEYASGDSGYLCYADYFSAENFARRITVPVLVSAGLIDFDCPPTTISRWFNILPSKDKKIVYIPGIDSRIYC